MDMQAQLSKMLFLEGKKLEAIGGKWLLLAVSQRQRTFHVFSSHAFVLSQEATKG